MHYENSKALLSRPPLVPSNLTPENVYFGEDYMLLKTFLRSTLHCSGKEDFEKSVKGFTDKERAKVAEMLMQCRNMGFYPNTVIDNDIKWGVALKGDIDIEMERNAEKYHKRGLQAKIDGSFMNQI